MVKICEAVHHAHQRGLIHRDLKPGNILVDETGQPKILDFGVARLAESEAHETQQTELGELVGTLAYMSPEQVLGDPLEVDTRSDVYSLGVVLFMNCCRADSPTT
jgi:serine/threonine protein kinase